MVEKACTAQIVQFLVIVIMVRSYNSIDYVCSLYKV